MSKEIQHITTVVNKLKATEIKYTRYLEFQYVADLRFDDVVYSSYLGEIPAFAVSETFPVLQRRIPAAHIDSRLLVKHT